MSIIYANNDNFEQAIASGKVLVDFYADWCGPCQQLGPIIAEIAEEQDVVRIVKLNVDEAQEIAGKYSVMSIPTMILFNDGEKIDQKVGVLQKEDIMTWIVSK